MIYFSSIVEGLKELCSFELFWPRTKLPLKEEVIPKILLLLSSPKARKHSAFPHTEFSASEVPAILKKFDSKEATSEAANLKLSWQLGRVYVTSLRRTRNWRQGEKPATDLAVFTRSAKSIFF